MGMYFLCWGAQNRTQVSRYDVTRKNYVPWPTGNAWMLLAALSATAHCWSTVNILPSRSPGSFSVKLLLRLQCVLVHRVNPQLLQDLAFLFVELNGAQEQDWPISQACWCPSECQHTHLVSTTHLNLLLSGYLLWVHSVSTTQYKSWYQSPWYFITDWSPAGHCAQHSPLRPAVCPVFSPSHCPFI